MRFSVSYSVPFPERQDPENSLSASLSHQGIAGLLSLHLRKILLLLCTGPLFIPGRIRDPLGVTIFALVYFLPLISFIFRINKVFPSDMAEQMIDNSLRTGYPEFGSAG